MKLRARTIETLANSLLAWAAVIAISTPMFWALLTSFKPRDEVLTFPVQIVPTRLTLENYSKILFDTAFLQLFYNSMVVSLGTTVLVLIVATLGAYSLTRFPFRGREFGAAIILFTYFLPSTIIVIPIYLTIRHMGLANSLLGLIIAYTTFALPFALWLLRLFFQTLPREIEAAARVDGASRTGTFFEIVLPQALPGIIATAIFTFIVAYNEYLFSFIFINTGDRRTLPVGILSIIKSSYEIEWNMVMAASVLMTVPVLVAIVSCQRYLLGGFGVGNVKG